ncbi:Methyltransferase-like protein 24 [Amphibalanus amphitrite]|uniref:Methyltransferase-like protein 24 n=1 Tax=Amphibalanus amphitrite TaxID=1232801 RepID=A0A6A4VAR0_AMPAM|nr:Methyltransferase-like protein 24 [Amphibalanus amphitrite]
MCEMECSEVNLNDEELNSVELSPTGVPVSWRGADFTVRTEVALSGVNSRILAGGHFIVMMSWRRKIRRLLPARSVGLWAVLMVTSTLIMVSRRLTDPLREDMAVNVLPPMPATDQEMVRELFHYLSHPNRRTCRKVTRMGGGVIRGIRWPLAMDGHKYVCLDGEQLDMPHTDRCLVYSFGISNDWSFDDSMADFGCTVFSFDPSINMSSVARSELVHFRPVGIKGADGDDGDIGASDGADDRRGWELLTLDTIAERLGHARRPIHYLKLDVEGAEWSVFRQQAALGAGSTLARVEQLGVELHFLTHLPPERHTDFYRGLYESLLALQSLGFYLFSFEENLGLLDWVKIPGLGRNLTTAFEVVWLRSPCARQAAHG